jgi:hypothetical protein
MSIKIPMFLPINMTILRSASKDKFRPVSIYSSENIVIIIKSENLFLASRSLYSALCQKHAGHDRATDIVVIDTLIEFWNMTPCQELMMILGPQTTSVKYGERAPYVSYGAFSQALSTLRSEGIGSGENVRSHIGTGFSDSVRRQILTSLRFFKFIDDGDCAGETLQRLLSGPTGADNYDDALRRIFIQSYDISEMVTDDGNIDQSAVDHILSKYSSSTAVTMKIHKFFLEMAKATGINVVPNGDPDRSGQPTRARRPDPPANSVLPRRSRMHHNAKIPITNVAKSASTSGSDILQVLNSMIKILSENPPGNNELPAVSGTIRWLARLCAAE